MKPISMSRLMLLSAPLLLAGCGGPNRSDPEPAGCTSKDGSACAGQSGAGTGGGPAVFSVVPGAASGAKAPLSEPTKQPSVVLQPRPVQPSVIIVEPTKSGSASSTSGKAENGSVTGLDSDKGRSL